MATFQVSVRPRIVWTLSTCPTCGHGCIAVQRAALTVCAVQWRIDGGAATHATRDILAFRQLYLQIAGLHVGDNDVDRARGNRMHLVVMRTCNVLGLKTEEAFLEIARELASPLDYAPKPIELRMRASMHHQIIIAWGALRSISLSSRCVKLSNDQGASRSDASDSFHLHLHEVNPTDRLERKTIGIFGTNEEKNAGSL